MPNEITSERIAVTLGDYDDVKAVFNRLPTYADAFEGFLLPADRDAWSGLVVEYLFDADYAEILNYHRVFVSSGTRGFGAGDDAEFVIDVGVLERVRTFVSRGGVLVCTDWTYDLIEAAYPEHVEFFGDDLVIDGAQRGLIEPIHARIHDPELERAVGASTLNLERSFSDGAVAVGVGPASDVLVSGDLSVRGPEGIERVVDAPLVVRTNVGFGQVVYVGFAFGDQPPQVAEQLVAAFVAPSMTVPVR